MSGFLRQLASRSLGTAPRLRSAPSPQAAVLQGIVPAALWRAGAQGDIGMHAGIAPSDPAGGEDPAAAWVRSARTPSREPATTARERDGKNPDSAGANGRDATTGARMPPAHFSATTISAEPAPPARDATEVARSPRRGPLALHAVHPDGDTSGALPASAAAVTPTTRPLSTAASPLASGTLEGAGKIIPSARPTPVNAGAIPARDASRGPGDAASASRFSAQPPSQPEVHITIDRLEVAPPPPAPRAAVAPRSSALSLRDYLAARRSGLP